MRSGVGGGRSEMALISRGMPPPHHLTADTVIHVSLLVGRLVGLRMGRRCCLLADGPRELATGKSIVTKHGNKNRHVTLDERQCIYSTVALDSAERRTIDKRSGWGGSGNNSMA